ncbi:glycoside hydrolase family 3 N-terminal domain-containing protein [Sphingomonas sp.]|uniref:glycoside hydrolase family 3 protein n=1 Tax=Sphingomonas sp. TaxID=28214 RepID=UPI003B00289A
MLPIAALAIVAAAPATQPPASIAHPKLWPKLARLPRNPKVEARIAKLLAAMSVEDKVGQLIQVDIASITPEDVETYKIGSVLNGGNSGPYGDDFAPPAKWLQLADEYYDASVKRADGRPIIPLIWGTDAVHGNNNIIGATLFPHNIGLGAARDPELVREIGAVTVRETAAAGLDWTFAPTLAVVQDDRWGRTYESYSENPKVQRSYAGAMVDGVQGKPGSATFLGPDHLIATTKHFLGDGGTGGRDQGDTRVSETVLRDVHLGGYPAALAAGTQSVMASFSSWNGWKMSGNRSLLTDVLKKRMGFDGFVVGDWNSHGQVPGCTNEDCPAAINAGLDMFMYSGPDFKALYRNTLAEVRSGTIPMRRLDDAVTRVLRVKVRAGTLDKGRPSSRPLAGRFALLGSPENRAVARRAVRETLVLLKNEGLLPLKPQSNILVAGRAADLVSDQAGGWSITWQGIGLPNSAFPHAETIWSGIEQAVEVGGGHATYAPDGRFTAKPDVAIVVFGEEPYAEFKGDRPNLEYSPDDKSDLQVLRRLKAAGVPVVAIFLSGRPLWVNAELNAADAFVAAFLPGSEGGGVADLLFRKPDGSIPYDFRGRLSFSWPKRPDQYVLNRRDPGYDPLFAYGYGLSYAHPGHVGQLDERRPAGVQAGVITRFFSRGAVPQGWTSTLDGAVIARAVDRRAQEDSRRLTWTGAGAWRIEAPEPLDFQRETNGEISLVVGYRATTKPGSDVTIGVADAKGRTARVRIGDQIGEQDMGQWTSLAVPLKCFAARGVDMASVSRPFELAATGGADLAVSDVRLDYASVPMNRCGD